MRVSKASVVLAIYGSSCVGKSALATELGDQWAVPVRHCGQLVKSRAFEIGVSPNRLPLESHRQIDADTRSLVEDANKVLVVEGIYLDVVLGKIPQVKLLKLKCDEKIRELRFLAKAGVHTTLPSTLKERDQEGARLRRTLYGRDQRPAEDWMVLDTTQSTPGEIVSAIFSRIKEESWND